MATSVALDSSPASESTPQTLTNPIHPSFLGRLDKDFIEYYNTHIATRPPSHGATIADLRAHGKKYANSWYKDFSGLPFVNDSTLKADDGYEFAVRRYAPDPEKSAFGRGPYPIHINFHENPFGKGHDDAWAAIRWVYEHGSGINARTDSISIGGISAGGTLAAVCQQLARDAQIPLKLAILAVPCVQAHDEIGCPEESPFPSYTENALAPCLNWNRIDYFRKQWGPKTQAEREALFARGEFFRSPVKGDMKGLCDSFIAVASADPFRDEGELYGRLLVEAGVRTTMRRYTGVPHPFMHMIDGVEKARMYLDDTTAELKRVHLH